MTKIAPILKSIEKLPPFPKLATMALAAMEDSESSLDQVVAIIEYDQAITANVLRICNSAYYGLNRKVHSLRQAMVLLGNAQIKEIILAGTVVRFFRSYNKGYALARGELWKHAVGAAVIARIICRHVRKAEPPSLFTAALLHDVGKVVLNFFVDGYFDRIITLVNEKDYSFLEAEAEILGINHAELGARIAESWSFPEDIVCAIRLHHNPEKDNSDSQILPIVYLANIITLSMGIGVGRDGLSYRGQEKIMKDFGFKARDLQEIIITFYDEFNKIRDILQL